MVLGSATASNTTRMVTHAYASLMNETTQEALQNNSNNINIYIHGVKGSVVIEGNHFNQAVKTSLASYAKIVSCNKSVQKLQQKLLQSAKSVVTGVTLGDSTKTVNDATAVINVGASLTNEVSNTCKSEASNTTNIMISKVGKNVRIDDNSFKQQAAMVTSCTMNALNSNSSFQKAAQAITQKAVSKTEGLSMWGLIVLIAVILAAIAIGGGSITHTFMSLLLPIAALISIGAIAAGFFLWHGNRDAKFYAVPYADQEALFSDNEKLGEDDGHTEPSDCVSLCEGSKYKDQSCNAVFFDKKSKTCTMYAMPGGMSESAQPNTPVSKKFNDDSGRTKVKKGDTDPCPKQNSALHQQLEASDDSDVDEDDDNSGSGDNVSANGSGGSKSGGSKSAWKPKCPGEKKKKSGAMLDGADDANALGGSKCTVDGAPKFFDASMIPTWAGLRTYESLYGVPKYMAGIALMALGAVMLVGAVFMIYLNRQHRKTVKVEHDRGGTEASTPQLRPPAPTSNQFRSRMMQHVRRLGNRLPQLGGRKSQAGAIEKPEQVTTTA